MRMMGRQIERIDIKYFEPKMYTIHDYNKRKNRETDTIRKQTCKIYLFTF